MNQKVVGFLLISILIHVTVQIDLLWIFFIADLVELASYVWIS
jgi:hypothetical protein